MLNELMLLRRTLNEIGVSTKPRHRDLSMLGKSSPVLRVFLNSGGEVVQVEAISKNDAPRHWTFRDWNQNSFPRIAFKPALRGSLSDDELTRLTHKQKNLDQRRELFMNLRGQHRLLIADLVPWLSASHREKIRLRGEALEIAADPRANLFRDLTAAFLTTTDEILLGEIDDKLAEALATAPSDDLLSLAIKFCFLDGVKSEKPTDACDLLFDFESPANFRRAADPDMINVLSNALADGGEGEASGICALTGRPARIEDDKFPQANLKVLGPTSLHTRNPQIPSAARYGMAGPDSMPVSRLLASELQAASEELTSAAREGKTWISIPSEKPNKRGKASPLDLLICYIPGAEGEDAASGMALDEKAFENLGERVAELSKGKDAFLPSDARIEICVLRKLNEGNKKAVYTASLRLPVFRMASERWRTACRSGPPITLYLPPGRKGEQLRKAEPRTLTPGRIVQLSRGVYIRDGADSYQATGITFADAFALIIRAKGGERTFKRRILRLLLSRGIPLLTGVGGARSRRKRDLEAIKPEARRDAVDLTALLAAILFQMEINQEQTMNSPAYLLGQLLAGADVLHRGYCLDVRSGSLPPKLIGNAALATAERNPVAALSQLLRRWKPYNGWATKRRRDDASLKQQIAAAEAKDDRKTQSDLRMIRDGAWAPENLRPLAEQLAAALITERPTDVFRAQLFLGYVAGLPRPEKKS
jgi:hypothetical protein